MHITLAPMEGVVDYLTRSVLSELGGLDHCVTEFIRVTDTPLPVSVFYRLCPELYHECKTHNQIPVTIQLLGNNPTMMALNACKAVALGAKHIDLNFGCPAKTVNKHKGGAVLLKDPEQIYKLVKTVRAAVANEIPVSAKMRLGYEDTALTLDNALAIESAGADSLTVHARTKVQGYRPSAHWQWISLINQTVKIPVTANGDIWTVADAMHIQKISGCDRIMLGRGIMRNPLLASNIRAGEDLLSPEARWHQTLAVLRQFIYKAVKHDYSPDNTPHPYFITDINRYIIGRTKQWLSMISKDSEQALALFQTIKRLDCSKEIIKRLNLDDGSYL